MTMLELKGRIDEAGNLEVDLPAGLPAGDVRLLLEVPSQQQAQTQDDRPWEESPWTEEEIRELMMFRPASGAEIVDMMDETDGWWKDVDITDSVSWVEDLRQRERERRKW